MKKFEELKKLVGTNFGFLTLSNVEQIPTERGRKACIVTFTCRCGTEKKYTMHLAGKIFTGDTISCGCFKKEQWRKAYYSWKKDWDRKFPKYDEVF